MRPSTPALAVDSTTDMNYDLQVSPRTSLSSNINLPTTIIPAPAPLQPSLRLLFSLLPQRHRLLLLLPAILSSLIAGGIAPFMTYVVGQTFSAFARYPLSNPSAEDKSRLLHAVGLTSLELVGLAVGALLLSSITSCLWIWTGERNVLALRRRVYEAVTRKDMVWFDAKMGAESDEQGQGPLGAAGLMAKFTRETDDVRAASSLALGQLIQYLTTTITCLVLAFTRSWSLTLVILSAVPLLILIQALSQATASPLLHTERTLAAHAAALVERASASIATVKAFNAQAFETAAANAVFRSMSAAGRRLNAVWGATSALGQFTTLAMFVQGFWFGAKLVREQSVDAGAVMAVFWACLIATSNLQMCIPQLIVLAKGKESARALLEVAGGAGDEQPPAYDEAVPFTAGASASAPPYSFATKKSRVLRKIRPATCAGEFVFQNVTFSYPARQGSSASSTSPDSTSPTEPPPPTLQDVSLFLPAAETTFIVGASGSGKSTVAALLLRLYTPPPGHGSVCLDERDVRFVDEAWLRARVMGVGQGYGSDVVFEGMSVAENIAVAVEGPRPAQGEVEAACRAALLHEFVMGLPEGYETVLSAGGQGQGGVCLSGGQRQRLAIARAQLRNPDVLVLDEATSALDATSRLLVFAALRAARQHRTTVVITHDLSQIEPGDFVYVMKDGRVVENGYRADLERPVSKYDSFYSNQGEDQDQEETTTGEFRKMLDVQLGLGGCLPAVELANTATAAPAPAYDDEEDTVEEDDGGDRFRPQTLLRPITLGNCNWMLDAVAELAAVVPRDRERAPVPPPAPIVDESPRKRRPSSIHIHVDVDVKMPERAGAGREREFDRRSLQFTPSSPVFPTHVKNHNQLYVYGRSRARVEEEDEDMEEEKKFAGDKMAMTRSGGVVLERRGVGKRGERLRWDGLQDKTNNNNTDLTTELDTTNNNMNMNTVPAFWATVRTAWPTLPYKPLFLLGLLLCALSGAMTPVFSFLLSRLLFEVSTGARDTGLINRIGGAVLGVAALDGALIGAKYFVMETAALEWVTALRRRAFAGVVRQDKGWFERPAGAPARLVQVLVKDAEDARNLVAVVAGQCVVVVCMLGVGLLWAMVLGWELTLVGLAVAPVFAGVMAGQTVLVAGCELRNKRAREEVARGYYEAVVNVRAIRAMAFGGVFREKFERAAERALQTGVRGAFVEGCTYGVASGLIYLAEALLFYVGAVLIVKGRYTYLQMVQVLNLVVFTVTIGSQLMAFTQRIAKSIQATSDFNHLLELSSSTPSDSTGTLRPTIDASTTSITFTNVQFAYPARPDVPVLRNVNLTIHPGESVAIVGASGSGKSTLAALLQRLYEPASGSITLGGTPLSCIDAAHLRDHVAVVSQHPHLFDASVAENIRYGSSVEMAPDAAVRAAAEAANVHEFVMGLPHGYDTHVGENAGLLSGGQAQRLQIARALVRPSPVLVLDECTSALDPENQRAVMEAVRKVKEEGGRTTVMVTHKLQVMRMCDRIVVLSEGEVGEQGTYEELVARKGLFATLASGGEWVGE